MPSKRRLRHASSTSAPQILLTNAKSGNLSSASLPSTAAAAALTGKGGPIPASSSSGTALGLSSTSYNSTNSQLHRSISSTNNNNINYNSSSNQLIAGGSGSGGVIGASSGVGGAGSSDGLTEKQLRNAYLATLTKEQLKAECRKRGQKITGNRTELLQRLGVKMSQLPKQEVSEIMGGSNLSHKTGSTNSMGNSKLSTKGSPGSPNGTAAPSFVRKQSTKDKERERDEREKIVLWRRPLQTLKYCALECVTLIQVYGKKLVEQRTFITAVIVFIALLGVFYKVPGKHQNLINKIRADICFGIYWVGLGVLSSVGFGTGLHTFILYLGPHIAKVTLSAYECNALNFPQPPYPDDIVCPDVIDLSFPPNIWNIMSKVRLEAFLWGAGTALGELPPYFMARAARLSGYDPDDAEDLQQFEELQKKKESGNLSFLDRAKLGMERAVERIGFLGILACASIPNPLFDLAGITCGHFLVPFWTFFGATLIGKAIIKMHIQKIFVIIAFNETLIQRAVYLLELIPIFGRRLQEPFKAFLQNQKTHLHRQKNIPPSESGNMLGRIFEKFVIGMVCYFIISIINSLAQSYHKRIHKKGGKVIRKLAKD